MRIRTTLALLLSCFAIASCAQNPWWEASQSGWAVYGPDLLVPRKAKPVPLSLMVEASKWNQPVYIEGWINSVDGENGDWMTISDGTSPPITIIPQSGFTLPRNARGRRAMAWGRPLLAGGTITDSDENVRRLVSVDFMAETVMIQGYYGLEASRPRNFERPGSAPQTIAEPTPTVPVEPVVEIEEIDETVVPPTVDLLDDDAAIDPPLVDLPDR